MTKWMGAVLLAAALTVGVPVQVSPASAASDGAQKAPAVNATDLGARAHYRHYHYAYRPYYPYYYGRPYYYSPGPFLLPFPLLPYGWEWW